MDDIKTRLQLVWGVLLVLAGVGLVFRIPQVMPQIEQIEYFAAVIPFIYFCMYFVGCSDAARARNPTNTGKRSEIPPGPNQSPAASAQKTPSARESFYESPALALVLGSVALASSSARFSAWTASRSIPLT
jgi:hypothetical protein